MYICVSAASLLALGVCMTGQDAKPFHVQDQVILSLCDGVE